MTRTVFIDPICIHCQQPETECAWLGGKCCEVCTHFSGLDANGNTIPLPPGRPAAPRHAAPVQLSVARLARIERIRTQWEREQQAET